MSCHSGDTPHAEGPESKLIILVVRFWTSQNDTKSIFHLLEQKRKEYKWIRKNS